MCGPSQSPFLTESIGEQRGVVRAIGAEDSGTIAMPYNPYLFADHPYSDLKFQATFSAG